MKRARWFVWLIPITSSLLIMGCGNQYQTSQDNVLTTNSVQAVASDQNTNAPDSQYEQTRRETLAKEMADAEKGDEQKLSHPELFTNPPPSEWPFPNYETGPGRPLPPNVNFYSMNDRYSTYLLCEYDVDEKNYNQSDEAGWFKTALEQVRESGPEKFPRLQWIAVIIINRAGWNGASTFEQAHKVGAIFKASDVFDSSHDLSQLVADATMDRHPFKYDTSQPTPGDQQRWLIVEQHAATNHASAGPN